MRPADWETKVLVRRIPHRTRAERKLYGNEEWPPTWYESKDDYDKTLANTQRYLEQNPDDAMQTEVIQVVLSTAEGAQLLDEDLAVARHLLNDLVRAGSVQAVGNTRGRRYLPV